MRPSAPPPALLILGVGNPSRGDDALGPLFIEQLETRLSPEERVAAGGVEMLTDFQLQIEHALDLMQRSLVLFVDAHVDCPPPYQFTPLKAADHHSVSTHALSPASVLGVYETLRQDSPPPCYLLGIRASSFELGESLSPEAGRHLEAALNTAHWLCRHPDPELWRSHARENPRL